ncbi:ABC transporter substrate-binding protein [Aliiruegeria sabulilitoris]|uniref:ABC transporter substrate-binding protein n=1 Tax=Aliiruegeria sabulilitoris TaxID=1510458 RepID=UPI000835735D|nr:ABC transporter substrate-binding protein [Aliiruegeria sabulilitoris]NDR58403.1 ABC transporter substrate-binding protein [Pseudoruegeria sp. M32A2M]
MRLARLASVLIALATLAGPARAFESEAHVIYEATPDSPVLRILSTTDIEIFEPMLRAFQERNPGTTIDYTVASSTEMMKALVSEGQAFDVALSSAMDLQTKLSNDGMALSHVSTATARLPEWANWRDQVFAFTQEAATLVVSPAAFEGLERPRNRQDLITLLREHPERFRGRIGTYDIRSSGAGYLFATQDARTSETFWRLMEVMGGLGTHLYCCSSEMIGDVASGKLAFAYNALGSYAEPRQAAGEAIEVVMPEDFVTVMHRTALIPASSESPGLGGAFVDFLLNAAWSGDPPDYYPFATVNPRASDETPSLRPIRIGPGLLVYLDDMKRASFSKAWLDAVVRE